MSERMPTQAQLDRAVEAIERAARCLETQLREKLGPGAHAVVFDIYQDARGARNVAERARQSRRR